MTRLQNTSPRVPRQSAAVKMLLDVYVAYIDDDRPSVRAGEGIRRVEQLRHQPRHLLAGERAVDFDGRLAGPRGADFLPHVLDVRAAILQRRNDQLPEERLGGGAHSPAAAPTTPSGRAASIRDSKRGGLRCGRAMSDD